TFWAWLTGHPAFVILWPIVTGVLAFIAGKGYEAWRERTAYIHRRWTSARLARRYLLFSRDQLRAVDAKAVSIGPARWEYWTRNIADFEEIKTRMIELEDDDLEERLYRWNAKTMDDLRELADIRKLSEQEYMERYGTNEPLQRPYRLEALQVAFALDAQE